MARTIDHLVLCVRDLAAARALYARLGFTLTPRAAHPWGTGNHLVQLGGNFLELLAVDDPSRIPPHRLSPSGPGQFSFGTFAREYLEQREGLAMLVFASADATADRDEFARAGLADFERFDFARDAELPDGSTARVGFSLAFVARPDWPDAAFFTCQQHAPEHFWKPDFQRHPNGATHVAEVVMAASRPAEHAAFLTALTGTAAEPSSAGIACVAPANDGGATPRPYATKLSLLAHAGVLARWPEARLAGAAPHFVGYRVAVKDLGLARAALVASGLPFRTTPTTLVVPPDRAFGTVIEFAEG